MKSAFKSAVFFLLYYSRLEWLLARLLPSDGCAIIMYHGICGDAPLPREVNFHLSARAFERQMLALKGRYRMLPLASVAQALAERRPLSKSVAITFDDGYRNNLAAGKILQRLNIPWTVYLTTAFVDSKEWIPLNRVYAAWSQGLLEAVSATQLRKAVRLAPTATRSELISASVPKLAPSAKSEESFAMLSWEEVNELRRTGADIGAHTHTHCNLMVETTETQVREICTSKTAIERKLNVEAESFAYPYGLYNESSRQAVIDAGFRCAVTTHHGLADASSDRYALPRIGYDERTWYFCCELLLQFLKHRRRGTSPLESATVAPQAGAANG